MTLPAMMLACSGEGGVWQRSMTLGTTANTHRQFDEAERFFLVALQEAGKFSPEDKRVLKTYETLAEFYHRRDRFPEAKPFYERVLQIKQQQRGEADPEVIADRNNLTQLFYVLGDYTRAESLGIKALQLTREVMGGDSPEMAELLRVISELYQKQGRFDEAEPLYLQELEVEKRDTSQFNIPMTLNNLAVFYHEWHEYAKAESLYHLSLEMNEKRLGKENYELLTVIINLAGFYRETGDYFRSEQLYRRALELHSKYRPRSYFKKVAILNKLAGVCLDQAKTMEARKYFRQALNLIDRGTGMHPDLLEILDIYGKLQLDAGELDDAMAFSERARKVRERLGMGETEESEEKEDE